MMKVEEFLTVFSQAKKDKDVGNIEDFREVLRLYDKSEDGTMIFDELKHILMSMGEWLGLTHNITMDRLIFGN